MPSKNKGSEGEKRNSQVWNHLGENVGLDRGFSRQALEVERDIA
jgi:hypothetical protein